MNNEKLHRDQKGENQQYINTNPSWENKAARAGKQRLRPIQTWGKEKPSTPTPMDTHPAQSGAGPPRHTQPAVSPMTTTHNVPFPEYPILQYLRNGTHSSGTCSGQQLPPQADLQLCPSLPPHFRSIPCLQLI